jgi:hypothetical protein
MSFSAPPFTTVLGWCEKNKCSRIEITNSEGGLVQTLFEWKNYNVIININPTSLISSIEINKILSDKDFEKVFFEENIQLINCLEILETQLS